MNTEQYRQPKPVDNLLGYGIVGHVGIENVKFWGIRSNGDKSCALVSKEDVGAAWAVPSNPPYDPCRTFRVGDIVCHVERAGRTYFDAPPLGEKCRVIEPENKAGIVCVEYKVNDERYTHEIPFYHLELVTPVEVLEPYYVKDDGTHYVVGKRPEEPEIVYLAEYSKTLHPHAKEAAEAERDRLNAEHRKGQNNV